MPGAFKLVRPPDCSPAQFAVHAASTAFMERLTETERQALRAFQGGVCVPVAEIGAEQSRRLDDFFALASVDRQKIVRRFVGNDHLLSVTVEDDRLEIELQQPPALCGADREALVADDRYVDMQPTAPDGERLRAFLDQAYMLPSTHRIFPLDLSRIPCGAFREVAVRTANRPNSAVQYPHGDVLLLTGVGCLEDGTAAGRGVSLTVDACFVAQ